MVAPKKLSKKRPATPAPNDVNAAPVLRWIAHPAATATKAPYELPAHEPRSVTAPSVPGSTRHSPVINRGSPPNAWPISEDTVSAVASTSAATHPVFIIKIAQPKGSEVSPLTNQAVLREAHIPATERFAIICAALLPCRFFPSPALAFRCRPARVARNVSRNSSTSGARPDRTTDLVHIPVQKVISKQIIPPNTAPPTVAASSLSTLKANAAHNTKTSSTKTGNRTPKVGTARTTSTLSPTSNRPTTQTSTRDCNRSLSSGIAFLHPVSPPTPRISSPIAQSHLPQ